MPRLCQAAPRMEVCQCLRHAWSAATAHVCWHRGQCRAPARKQMLSTSLKPCVRLHVMETQSKRRSFLADLSRKTRDSPASGMAGSRGSNYVKRMLCLCSSVSQLSAWPGPRSSSRIPSYELIDPRQREFQQTFQSKCSVAWPRSREQINELITLTLTVQVTSPTLSLIGGWLISALTMGLRVWKGGFPKENWGAVPRWRMDVG